MGRRREGATAMPTAVTVIATVIAWAVSVGIILIGIIGLSTPKFTLGFGIPGTRPTDPAFRAWLAVKAVRDIGAGLLVIVVLLAGPDHLRGWMAVVGGLIALGDAV